MQTTTRFLYVYIINLLNISAEELISIAMKREGRRGIVWLKTISLFGNILPPVDPRPSTPKLRTGRREIIEERSRREIT